MKPSEDQQIQHNCGVAGIYSHNHDVTGLMLSLLYSLQHRGQEGAGMWVTNGKEGISYRGAGWAKQVFTTEVLDDLSSIEPYIAIGQDRYSTSGNLDAWQPFITDEFALVHNGNITNAKDLLKMLPKSIQNEAKSDTWIAHQFILNSKGDTIEEKLVNALPQIEGSYNFVMEYKGKMYACRDPWGFRPLVIGILNDDNGYVIASESAAFGPIGAKFLREVREGEAVVISDKGIKAIFMDNRLKKIKTSHCIFEYIYLAAPDSIIFGKHVTEVRYECGRKLAIADVKEGFLPDIIIPIMGSGGAYGQGYAEEMIRQVCKNPEKFNLSSEDIPETAATLVPKTGLVTNYYSGRVFISPKFRENASILKHRVNEIDIRGKKVVIVDDSLVRGTTAKKITEILKNSGAAEIHWRIASPQILHPCFMGVDFATHDELIAAQSDGNIEKIQEAIGNADSLRYLKNEELVDAVSGKNGNIKDLDGIDIFEKTKHCGACFTGRYPVNTKGIFSK
ncbi:MAG: amidophosphoribosyltransferase [bacterium]